MRAAVIVGPEKVEVEEVNLREPLEDEVRVRVTYCGVCASNIPPWEGRPWFQYPMDPGALGHEGVGVIDAVGSAVEDWQEGEAVAFLGQHSYAEYDFAPTSALVRLPAALAQTPFPAEPLACAWNILRRARIEPADTVALVGAGFLGVLILHLLQQRGISALAITRRADGLRIAQSLGAETARFGTYTEVIDTVSSRFKEGCHVVIEATGKQSALDLASELTRERGRLVIAGYHQDGLRTVNLQLWNWRGIDVINAHERDPQVYGDAMRQTIQLTAEGRLDPLPFISHRFPLEKLGEALTLTRDRPEGFTKATIQL
jgi:threonine dehydrogenase-like Zn-dependent dehydrogenase